MYNTGTTNYSTFTGYRTYDLGCRVYALYCYISISVSHFTSKNVVVDDSKSKIYIT